MLLGPVADQCLYALRAWVVHVQPGSAEMYLRDTCQVPTQRVDRVMAEASAWRITPNGRILVDRRRRSRVERNLTSVVEYLVNRCGLPPGVPGCLPSLCSETTAIFWWVLQVSHGW